MYILGIVSDLDMSTWSVKRCPFHANGCPWSSIERPQSAIVQCSNQQTTPKLHVRTACSFEDTHLVPRSLESRSKSLAHILQQTSRSRDTVRQGEVAEVYTLLTVPFQKHQGSSHIVEPLILQGPPRSICSHRDLVAPAPFVPHQGRECCAVAELAPVLTVSIRT